MSRADLRQQHAAHLQRLKEVPEKITHLQSQLPANVDRRLNHFLKNCSYDKALALLESL
jgi:hypothetical protein